MSKPLLIIGLFLAAGVIVIAIATRHDAGHGAPAAVQQTVNRTPPAPEMTPASLPSEVPVEETSVTNTEPAATVEPALVETTASPSTPATQSAKAPKRELQDPLAREALKLVGADAYAEEYWLAAINDPEVPASERSDLIEDLNENGFSADNGRRATVEDLPLILRRIEIIEELAPCSIDEVNWAAFREAEKDLMNMYARLTQ